MELDVSATDECEFFGLVVRTANGECKRFAPFAGDNTCDSVAVGKGGFKRYCVCLGEWLLQDSNKQTASEEERKKIAEAQLLFRGTKPVTVRVKNIGLCDERIKMNVEEQCIADEREFRADTVVMQR